MTKLDSFQETNTALMFEKEIFKNHMKIPIQKKKFAKKATFMDKFHSHDLSKGIWIQKKFIWSDYFYFKLKSRQN